VERFNIALVIVLAAGIAYVWWRQRRRASREE
jgi:cbb3-type cytochrome oxidase subunit 3